MKVIKYGIKKGEQIKEVLRTNERGTLTQVKMMYDNVITIPVDNIVEVEETDAIDSFLKNWEVKANKFYANKREQFLNLSTKEISPFRNELTKSAFEIIANNTDEEITEMVKMEAQQKKKNLINRIEKKAGKIIDATELNCGANGEINGLIIGENEKVKVQTIYAGGENIQALHFRVLVNEVRK